MPLPFIGPAFFAFLPPIPPIPPLLGPGLSAYAPSSYTLSSVSLGTIVARKAWNRLPKWIQDDLTVRSFARASSYSKHRKQKKSNNDENDYVEELSSLWDILPRLMSLLEEMRSIQGHQRDNETSEQSSSMYETYARVHAYWQLICHFHRLEEASDSNDKRRFGEHRDALYESCGLPRISSANTASDRRNDEIDVRSLQSALEYAIFAYRDDEHTLQTDLASCNPHMTVLTHVQSNRPGYVGYYVAFDATQNMLLIGVKGTSTLEDILTDCCGTAVSMDLLRGEEEIIETSSSQEHEVGVNVDVQGGCSSTRLMAHEGILLSAKRLADEVEDLVRRYTITKGCSVLVCGHSLGAGVSCLLAIMLQSRIPSLYPATAMVTSEITGSTIRVVVFGTPPVLNKEAAKEVSSYITSVVNNADIIPRCSFRNMNIFCRLLDGLEQRSVTKPRNGGARPRSGNQSWTSDIKRRLMTTDIGTKLESLTGTEFHDCFYQAVEEQDAWCRQQIHESCGEPVDISTNNCVNSQELYVPGRVILLFEKWTPRTSSKTTEPKTATPLNHKGTEFPHPDQAKISTVATGEHHNQHSNIKQRSNVTPPTIAAGGTTNVHCAMVTNGEAKALSFFELDGYKMLTDHTTSAYQTNLQALL